MKIKSIESKQDLDLIIVTLNNVSFAGTETMILTMNSQLEIVEFENNSSLSGSDLTLEINIVKRHVSEIMSAY